MHRKASLTLEMAEMMLITVSEVSDIRLWHGEIHLVIVYERSMSFFCASWRTNFTVAMYNSQISPLTIKSFSEKSKHPPYFACMLAGIKAGLRCL